VGPSAGLDAVVKRKIPSPSRDSNPRSSSPQRYTTELSWLLLNLSCTPHLRLQVSDRNTSLSMFDVPNAAVCVENLLNALLVLFTDIL